LSFYEQIGESDSAFADCLPIPLSPTCAIAATADFCGKELTGGEVAMHSASASYGVKCILQNRCRIIRPRDKKFSHGDLQWREIS